MKINNLNNLNSQIKTIKLGLNPTDLTNINLLNNSQVQTDKTILSVYETIVKPAYSKMHEKFINEATSLIRFDNDHINEYYNLVEKLITDKEYKSIQFEKDAEPIIKLFRTDLGKCYDSTVKNWCNIYEELKIEDGLKILTTKGSLNIITKPEFMNEVDKIKLLDVFTGFFTYLTTFNTNKMNYYSLDKENTISYRLFNENILRYMKNCFIITKHCSQLENIDEAIIEDYYRYCNQDGIDKYNEIIGNYNSIINENNQINSKVKGFLKIPKLKVLYKQIGSLKGKKTFILEFKVNDVYNRVKELAESQVDLINAADKYFHDKLLDEDETLKLILLNKAGYTNLSNKIFRSWNILASEVMGYKDDKKGDYKSPKVISLYDIKAKLTDKSIILNPDLIFKNYNGKDELSLWNHLKIQLKDLILLKIQNAKAQTKLGLKKFDVKTKLGKIELKLLCDEFLELERLIGMFKVSEADNPDPELQLLIEKFEIGNFDKVNNNIIPYYNAFRSLVTKKISQTIDRSIKINFGSSSFLGSFGSDFGTNEAMMIKNKEKYYLLVVNGTKIKPDVLTLLNSPTKTDSSYLTIDFQKPDAKNLSRIFYKSKGENYAPNSDKTLLSKEFKIDNKIYSTEQIIIEKLFTVTSNRENYKPFLNIVMDYYFQCITQHADFKKFNLKFDKSLEYNNLNDFCDHLRQQCYKIKWNHLNWDKVLELEKANKFYLFELYTKDFSKESKGKPNKQTLFFLAALDPEVGSSCRIAGNGKILFRPKLESDQIKLKDKRSYRYLRDQFLLHFPLSIGTNDELNFNSKVNLLIQESENINVIGLDRGEKNLAYYSVINSKGIIIEQGSLDTPLDDSKDYNQLLEAKADNMMEARKNWETISKIKDLKMGYLSQVNHKIATLMLKHNAILAIEDLNQGFMSNRSAKVEKSVYKKFENELAKSLSNIVIKDVGLKYNEIGSVVKPYTLTPKFDNEYFENSKQWGTLFFVRAAYTSQVDPVSGWRKTNLKDEQIFEMINNGEFVIEFNDKRKCVVFKYTNLNSKVWELDFSEKVKRIIKTKNINNQFEIKYTNLKDELDSIFKEHKIQINSNLNNNIQELIIKNSILLKSISWLYRLATRIRNSDSKKIDGIDAIYSAVWSEKINDYFNSEKYKQYLKLGIETPIDADANGAYNIARKGLIIANRIKEKPEKVDYFVSDENWDEYLNQI